MNLTYGLILLTVLALLPSAASTQNTPAKESPTVTYSGNDLLLQDIFSIIKKQTGHLFFYDAALITHERRINIKWNQLPVDKALNELFAELPFTWLIEDNTITITKRTEQSNSAAESTAGSLPFNRVSGIIVDQDGTVMSGATIMVKGSKKGTVSDDMGDFEILAHPKDLLLVSAVGYIDKSVIVENSEMRIKLEMDIKPMEALLVGGNLNAIKRKSEVNSITVLTAKTLEKIPANTLDQIFRGWVPGVNNFDVGPEPEGFPAVTIRGAIGPGSLDFIAVYIDGIEFAGGSGYLSQLDKNNIERIEIVRGPGAATLYGTGSNGGIIQIFTKKPGPGQHTLSLTSSVGFMRSKWVEGLPFHQMHNMEMATAVKNLAFKLGGSFRSTNAYLPDGGDNNKSVYASATLKQKKLQVSLIGRYGGRSYHLTRFPFFDTAVHPRKDIMIEPVAGQPVPAFEWLSVKPTPSKHKDGIAENYIGGLNLSHQTARNWLNRLDAGVTQNNNAEIPVLAGYFPLQRTYNSVKTKITTIRYSNVLTLNGGNDLGVSITTGGEFKKSSRESAVTRATAAGTVHTKNPDNNNYGAFIQVNPSFRNIFLTLGLRYEKNEIFKEAWNPRVGLTTNFTWSSIIIKPRISWGRGITSPLHEYRFGTPANPITVVLENPNIRPQTQQGFDYGLEIYDKTNRYRFEAIYYDNTLKNMFAQEDAGFSQNDPGIRAFIWNNVSSISNTGWEFSGQYQAGRFSMQGTLSLMSSTIKDSTGSYLSSQLNGKPPGTRMPNLPRRTVGLNVAYNFNKLFGKADKGFVSINVTGVDGVVFTDLWGYYLDVAYGRKPYVSITSLRPQETSTVFRVGLYADYNLMSDFRFFVQGSNILNDYKVEQNTSFTTHGASWLFGFKYQFSKNQ